MSKFKNENGKSKRLQYREYVRAKRTFLSCVAKIKNCVNELHYQTNLYLLKHYDVILLPIFLTKDMVGEKSARADMGST
jgi:ABC-type protease/lipase transport system fused ATPase/permease subunit